MKINKGFTLVELLVVATIIAILAGIGVTSYISLSRQSRDSRRKADLENLRSALEMYRSENNYYPLDLSELIPSKYVNNVTVDPKTQASYVYCPSPGVSGNQLNYDLCASLEQTSNTTTCCSVSNSCGTGVTCNYKLTPLGEE